MLKNTQETYGSLSKWLHWVVLLLILGMLLVGYLMTGNPLVNIHKFTGLLVLTLVAIRLIWILLNKHPLLPVTCPLWEKLFSRMVQALLYVCMFGMPLSGWSMATAFGFPPKIAGLSFPMPGLRGNPHLAHLLESVHNTLAIVLIALISLHVLGALKHHFIDKDSVLKNILPSYKRPEEK